MNKILSKILIILFIFLPLFSVDAKTHTKKKKTQHTAVSKRNGVKKKSTAKKKSATKSSKKKKTKTSKKSRKSKRTRRAPRVIQPRNVNFVIEEDTTKYDFPTVNATNLNTSAKDSLKVAAIAELDTLPHFHVASKMLFPLYIDNFKRTKIIGGNDESEINVMYRVHPKSKIPGFIISLTPADSLAGNLEGQYEVNIQKVASVGNHPLPPSFNIWKLIKNKEYNGIQGTIKLENSTLEQLRVYKFGDWFMRILFMTDIKNPFEMEMFANEIVDKFKPEKLVEEKFPNTN